MSKEAVQQFREAINLNTEWQEEVRTNNEPQRTQWVVTFAKDKGYEFTYEEYIEYVNEYSKGELSEFEIELVVGGASCEAGQDCGGGGP